MHSIDYYTQQYKVLRHFEKGDFEYTEAKLNNALNGTKNEKGENIIAYEALAKRVHKYKEGSDLLKFSVAFILLCTFVPTFFIGVSPEGFSQRGIELIKLFSMVGGMVAAPMFAVGVHNTYMAYKIRHKKLSEEEISDHLRAAYDKLEQEEQLAKENAAKYAKLAQDLNNLLHSRPKTKYGTFAT